MPPLSNKIAKIKLLNRHIVEECHVTYFHSDSHNFELGESGFEHLLLDHVVLLRYFVTETLVVLIASIITNDEVFE